MHALVIGAGISGPALALALRRSGHTADVFEARPAASDGEGGFFNVAPNGMRALHDLGVGDRIDTEGFHSRGIRFLNASGREVGALSSSHEHERFGVENRMLRRSQVRRALVEAAEGKGADTLYGKRLMTVREGPDRVTAVFEDGSTAEGDVLFGCDGVRSAVRQEAFPEAPGPEFTGLVNGGGYTRLGDVPGDRLSPGVQLMVFGKRAFFGAVAAPEDEVWWFSNLPWPVEPRRGELAAISSEDWRDRLLAQHGADPTPVPDLIRAAYEVWVSWADLAMPPLDTWHTRRVCLVGDAAHATPPHSGQGASLALEDVLVLARELREAGPPAEAFSRYEAARKRRAERVVAQARRTGGQKAPGPVGAAVRDLVLPLFLRFSARQAAALHAYRVEGAP